MNTIEPGCSVDLIFESDYHRGSFCLLNAIAYEVAGRKITLSQPTQPLMPHHLGQNVIVTYCIRQGGKTERHGFSATVASLIKDYAINAHQHSAALVLERKSETMEMNVRLHFRIQPTMECGLALYYKDKKLNLVDISLGGARFSRENIEQLSTDDRIRFRLEIDNRTFDLQALVVRSWLSIPAGRTKKIQFVAVKFLHDNRDLEQILSNKIMAIQRQLLIDAKLRKDDRRQG